MAHDNIAEGGIVSDDGVSYKITPSGRVKFFYTDWYLSSKPICEIRLIWINQIKSKLGIKNGSQVMAKFKDRYIKTGLWQTTKASSVCLSSITGDGNEHYK